METPPPAHPDNPDLVKLAKQVLYVLAKQQVYFDKRTPEALRECTAVEAKLKEKCQRIVDNQPPPPKQLDLFDQGAEAVAERERRLDAFK